MTQARIFFFFFQAEDGIRDYKVTGVQTCALPIWQLHRDAARDRQPGGPEHDGLAERHRYATEPGADGVVYAVVQRAHVQLHEHEQRSRRLDRELQLDLRGRRHVDAPEPVAQLRGGRDVHGDAAGHGQPGGPEHDGVAERYRYATEPGADGVVYAVVQRAHVQLHEHEQRSRRLDRELQLDLRGRRDVDAPEPVAQLRGGRDVHGDAAGHGQPGSAEHDGLAERDRDSTQPCAGRERHLRRVHAYRPL